MQALSYLIDGLGSGLIGRRHRRSASLRVAAFTVDQLSFVSSPSSVAQSTLLPNPARCCPFPFEHIPFAF
ncbi:hypothetical protein KCU90_g69, partial [Aureobasidium melanogenum]